MNRQLLFLVLTASLLVTSCGRKGDDKPPEKMANITTSVVEKRDLQVVESAVGNATSLGVAQALDPNRVRRGSFSVRLPFPEHVARNLKIGQPVKLTSFDDPDRSATAAIREIRPALDTSTQTMEVIAELKDGKSWYSVGSVKGDVVVGVRRGAVVAPEQAVVLRPAGAVVYVIDGDQAREQIVQTGLLRDGRFEIVSGLKGGETVAVDGASLLTGGAKVRVMDGPGANPKAAP